MKLITPKNDTITLYAPGDGSLRINTWGLSLPDIRAAVKQHAPGYAVVVPQGIDPDLEQINPAMIAIARSFAVQHGPEGRGADRHFLILTDRTTCREYHVYYRIMPSGYVSARVYESEGEDDPLYSVKNESLIGSIKFWIKSVIVGGMQVL